MYVTIQQCVHELNDSLAGCGIQVSRGMHAVGEGAT